MGQEGLSQNIKSTDGHIILFAEECQISIIHRKNRIKTSRILQN